MKIINDHQYGNGASIYTQDGYWARRFKLEAECGMIGINVGIPAPVAHLPFGGMKASLYSRHQSPGTGGRRFLHRTEDRYRTLSADRNHLHQGKKIGHAYHETCHCRRSLFFRVDEGRQPTSYSTADTKCSTWA